MCSLLAAIAAAAAPAQAQAGLEAGHAAQRASLAVTAASPARPPNAAHSSTHPPTHPPRECRHQLQQIARVLRDTDPSLYNKLQLLGAEDCMFAYRWVGGWVGGWVGPASGAVISCRHQTGQCTAAMSMQRACTQRALPAAAHSSPGSRARLQQCPPSRPLLPLRLPLLPASLQNGGCDAAA